MVAVVVVVARVAVVDGTALQAQQAYAQEGRRNRRGSSLYIKEAKVQKSKSRKLYAQVFLQKGDSNALLRAPWLVVIRSQVTSSKPRVHQCTCPTNNNPTSLARSLSPAHRREDP